MRITFADKSYIECYKSATPGNVMIVITANDGRDKNKRISNAAELTREEFTKLLSEVV